MTVTAEERDDFDVHMLKDVVENAATVVEIISLLDSNVRLIRRVAEPRDLHKFPSDTHTRKLQAWDGMLDLYVNREALKLDEPRDIPFRIYLTEEECKVIYRRIKITMKHITSLGKLWSDIEPGIDVVLYMTLLDLQPS